MEDIWINIAGIQFNVNAFKDWDKPSFVTFYQGKFPQPIDINEAWDIIQDHIKPIKREEELKKKIEFDVRSSSKVKRK